MPSITIRRRYIRQSTQKIRAVTELIKRRPVDGVIQQLTYFPKRAAREVLKAVKSAKAAAMLQNMKPEQLTIERIVADQGPATKRILPGSRGRTYRIKKMMTHVTVTVSDGLTVDKNIQKSVKSKIKS